MSPQGFVNNTTQFPHQQQHGFSQPSHNPTQQVTMNINMNMYPNVMNINMGQVQPTLPVYPQQTAYIAPNQQFLPTVPHHGVNQSKPIQYNDFFTNGVTPPPNVNGITL